MNDAQICPMALSSLQFKAEKSAEPLGVHNFGTSESVEVVRPDVIKIGIVQVETMV